MEVARADIVIVGHVQLLRTRRAAHNVGVRVAILAVVEIVEFGFRLEDLELLLEIRFLIQLFVLIVVNLVLVFFDTSHCTVSLHALACTVVSNGLYHSLVAHTRMTVNRLRFSPFLKSLSRFVVWIAISRVVNTVGALSTVENVVILVLYLSSLGSGLGLDT